MNEQNDWMARGEQWDFQCVIKNLVPEGSKQIVLIKPL